MDEEYDCIVLGTGLKVGFATSFEEICSRLLRRFLKGMDLRSSFTPIWNFLHSKIVAISYKLELLGRRSFFENLHLDSTDKLIYKLILK